MTKAIENKIEMVKVEFKNNFFTGRQVKELLKSDFIRTLVKNTPDLIIDKQVIKIEISETEYNDFMSKYENTMDTKNFGGVGMCWTENGKFYNKRVETRYKFNE